jgi:hypothetical protein
MNDVPNDEQGIRDFLPTVERFSFKEEQKLLKAVSALFQPNDVFSTLPSEVEVFQHDFMVLDPAICAGIIPKSPKMRLLLRRFASTQHWTKVPTLEYKRCGPAAYYFGYLDKFHKILKAANYPAYTYETAKDYPLRISCEDFDLILAPRIDDE